MASPAAEYPWDITFPIGHEGEVFVADLLQAERPGVEVKVDRGAARTGNAYVEYECLYPEGWRPSGILHPGLSGDGLWAWVFGEGSSGVIVAAPVDSVRRLCRWYYRHDARSLREQPKGTHPNRGLAIPLDRLLPGLVHEWAYPNSE